jgi:hypothetical protein
MPALILSSSNEPNADPQAVAHSTDRPIVSIASSTCPLLHRPSHRERTSFDDQLKTEKARPGVIR